MKNFEKLKTIQLIVYGILAVLCFVLVIFRADVQRAVRSAPALHIVTILLWIVMAVSFFFLFLDFTYYQKQEKSVNDLSDAVHSDPTARIANRLSCDEMIEKYLDHPLPEDFGCVMLEITNIRDINQQYGHVRGNQMIKRFSTILKLASVGHCFVGRNGGNQFLALFEHGSDESIQSFLNRVREQVEANNQEENSVPIEFRSGIAFHEPKESQVDDITSLIALSSRRAEAADAAVVQKTDARPSDDSENSGTSDGKNE